ncbi:hypothetical protein [Brevibacillus fulvus]|uniref:Uncharacterized protein n=1 Tax=Brevibacillus fulvus TaxID=1125967 RepID=A0A939BTM2_9BACL|nr:hypothetical protein [Brevibacillus fulvus]MBM7588601.1 hypothetical protein [Brevibacillus fulvus]
MAKLEQNRTGKEQESKTARPPQSAEQSSKDEFVSNQAKPVASVQRKELF